MGMYDEVGLRCPICQWPTTVQSKGGPCQLNTYSLSNAPLGVLDDVVGKTFTCKKCGEYYTVEMQKIVLTVATTSPRQDWEDVY